MAAVVNPIFIRLLKCARIGLRYSPNKNIKEVFKLP